jgi:hypothetical protein
MAQAQATILQEINGLYVAVYGRAADGPGINYWCGTLGVSVAAAATTPVTVAQQTALGQAFVNTQSTYFLTQYPTTMNDITFVQALYMNIGGNTGDAGGIAYWFSLLQAAEGPAPTAAQITAARAGLVGQFTHDMLSIDLTAGAAALGLTASDYAAAVARQAEFQNKVSVSQYYANLSNGPNGNILVATSTSSAAFTAAQEIIAGVTNNASTVTAADAAISAVFNTSPPSLAPITTFASTPPVGTTFTLTTGVDAPGTGAFAAGGITGNNNLVFGTFGTAATFNTGDNIVAPVGSTANTLTLTDAGTGGTGTPTAVAATVSNFSNVNVIGAEAETVNTAAGFSGLTQLTVTAVDAAIGGSTVTAAGTTNIAFNNSSTTAANTDSIQGGLNVVVTETGVAAAGIINVGTTTAPAGTVAITETTTNFGGTASAINATGGTTITVTANLAAGTGTTNTGGIITVTGSAATTAVTVNQSNTATGAAAVAAVTGVVGVAAVVAAPGVQAVAAVNGGVTVAAVPAAAAVQGVVDGKVAISDATAGSLTAAGTITTITLNGYGAASTISDNALATLNLNGTPFAGNTLTITDSLTVPVTSLALNLNAYSTTGTIVDATIKTLNVTTTGTSSSGGFTDAALTTLNVMGTGALTLKGLPANTALATVAISGAAGFSDGATTVATGLGALGATLTSFTTTSSGTITAALDDTTQTFVGSTGQDIITVSDLANATKVITGGSATNNELILDGGAYALTSATAAKVTGFETLGVTANVTGTIDASILGGTSFTKLDIIGAGTIAFTKVAQDAGIALDAGSSSTTVGYVDASGVTDVVAVIIGAATNKTAVTPTLLSVADSNGVGIGTLNVTSNDSTFNTPNVITTLTDNGLANLNVSGTGGLTITTLNEATTQATVFTLNDTETNAAGVTITTFTDNNLGSLVFTGSNASTITTLIDTGAVLSITNTGTSTASIGTLTDNTLTTLTLGAGVSLGQAGTADFTKGLQDTSAAGVTVSGVNDSAHVTIKLAGAATGLTDNITLGNGNDAITDASTAGTVNVNVGTGSNLIVLGGTTTDTTAVYNVSLGAHTLATGPDFFSVGTAGAAFATAANLVVTGAVIGDQLTFAGDGASSNAALTTTGATTIVAIEAAAVALGPHGVAFGTVGANTYVAESLTGTAASAVNMTLVEIMGTHTFTAATGHLTILT